MFANFALLRATLKCIERHSLKHYPILYLNSPLFLKNKHFSTNEMNDKLIWVDCEMTGLDVNKDRLLEIALILTDSNLNQVDKLNSVFIQTPSDVLAAMGEWHQKHFSQNGLIEQCKNSKITLEDADNMLNEFMRKHKIDNGILAGNSIGYDRKFLDKYCPKFTSHLHYRMVDVSSVKVLVNMWYNDTSHYNKTTEHRALSDILQSIEELKYYRSNFFKVL